MRTQSYSRRLPVAAMLFLIVSVMFIGCKKEVPGANEVWMQNTAFTPSTITISVNSTVKWTNKDQMDHNVTSNTSGQFSSGTISAGGTYSHQFTTAGSFPYSCTIHAPSMTGTVIVQ